MNSPNNLQKMYDARLEKSLNKLYNFGDSFKTSGIMSLREFFELNPPLYKKIYIREYENHRKHLEYRKLSKPKMEYTIFYTENRCLDVSKMVYEYYDIPIRE